MPNAQETVLEINFTHLEYNFNYLKSKLDDNTKILAVVKAFAYGSDAEKVALKLQDLQVDYFAVAYVNEGISLRKAGITTPILVLHPQPVNFKALIENCLEPSLYNTRTLAAFIALATEAKQTDYPIHIKFNTGLNRLGFCSNAIPFIANQLNTTTAVKVTSLFSHLAASEDSKEKAFTTRQISSFNKIVKAFRSQNNDAPFLHLVNTSGVLNYPEAHFDMVRTGIGLYGYGNDSKFNKYLKPVVSLKSVISQIHQIEKNETVGYNRAFKAAQTMKTATIPIGHADGISRQWGNGNGALRVHGKKAPIIGHVCMDMIMIDITNIPCEEGDEVVLFDMENTAADFAKQGGTISYEILTAISQRISRLYID
jgi:alanine racemase